jgi:NTE family protein
MNGPRVGVVLGSGGIKPVAAVALFEFLWKEQIPFELMAGCSGGGLLAAGVGMGMSSQEIRGLYDEFFRRKPFSTVDYRTVLGIANAPFGRFGTSKGLIKGSKLHKFYKDVFGDARVEDLRPATLLQATDIQSGRGVVLDRGRVADAVYASAAMYPLVPPIRLNDQWLVDGAFTSPLPLMEAVRRGMDVIVAMVFDELNNPEPRRFREGFLNIISTFTRSLIQNQISLSIDLHHYEIVVIHLAFEEPVRLYEVDKVDAILEAGRRAVAAKEKEIRCALDNFQFRGTC